MRNVSYLSNGQPIEEQEGPLRATQVTRHNNLPPRKCCGCGSRNTLDVLGDPHDSQVLVLRVVGILAVVIGLTEVGLGASLFTYFSNVRSGAWWSVVMVVITGKSLSSKDQKCLLSSLNKSMLLARYVLINIK